MRIINERRSVRLAGDVTATVQARGLDAVVGGRGVRFEEQRPLEIRDRRGLSERRISLAGGGGGGGLAAMVAAPAAAMLVAQLMRARRRRTAR
ncbi:MAG: hypothetical protein HYX50_02835 [Chloroflexi bacterium]|nr:hypothetical protein [Chloroflexota bacterium]